MSTETSGLSGSADRPTTSTLPEGEELFRLMADAIPQIVWVTDALGRAEFFNRQWYDYVGEPTGSSSGSAADEVATRFIHPDDQALTMAAFDEARQSCKTFVVEHRIRSANGSYRWFLVRGEPYRDQATGKILRWFGSSTDIHDRRKAEEALRVGKERGAWLLMLSDAIRPLRDPEAVKVAASRVLGERLQVNRAFYAETDGDAYLVEGGYAQGVAPLPPGRYSAITCGLSVIEKYRAGERLVIRDTRGDSSLTPSERDAHIALTIHGAVGMPLVKEGKLVAILAVHTAEPRDWTEDDIALMEETAERTCAAIERARVEAQLRQQWHTFDIALSHTPDFTYIFDLDGRFTYINHALLSLWQKSFEEARGKNFFELGYPPELAARLQRQIQQVIETGVPLRDDTPFTGPSGETRHYEYIFVPVFGLNGKVEAVTGSTRDVTDRERMEQELTASRERLQQIFQQAPVAVAVFRGREMVCELANASYRAFFPGRDLLNRPLFESVPEASDSVRAILYRVLDTGEPFIGHEYLIQLDQDGDGVVEDCWFTFVYQPLEESPGVVAGIVVVAVDVSTQVRARQEQERVNRELEEFAYVASHDLQEPLRMVTLYTQLLLRRFGQNQPEAEQFAQLVRQGVTRMEALIRDLLTYSRTVQRDDVSHGTADLSVALREAKAVLENRIEENGAAIVSEPLPLVRGDTHQMAHVFQNLLSNSLKYRRKDISPEVRISAERKGEHWQICVRDNGIGFDPRYAERIFGLFKRLHRDEYPGTGLGLAICQRIVERYGGRMWAESQSGTGSVFFFSLPAAE